MKAIGRLLVGLFRLLLLPFKLLAAAIGLAFRLGVGLGRLPVLVTARVGRLLGVRGVVFGLLGLAVGLLFAPGPGRDLRARLLALASGGGVIPDDELADKVIFELAHAPRTWHLEPQPDVAVVAGKVSLAGPVESEAARDELERVASSVPGVVEVDNRLVAPVDTDA